MSVKKHKRKTTNKSKNNILKNSAKHDSIMGKHPRAFFYLGTILVLIGIALLVVGIHNNAKVGLAMLSIFIGGAAVILSNSSLPKKAR